MKPPHVQAFLQFSGASEKDIRYKTIDRHYLIEHKGTTYLISSPEDFKETYKSFFEEKSYDEIYTEIPEQLWHYMLNDYVEIEPHKFIVEMYRQWKIYWSETKKSDIPNENWYKELREQSWKDLLIFIEAYKLDTNSIMDCTGINDIEFVPLVAMTIKEQFENVDEFLDNAVETLVENCGQYITMGDTFERSSVKVGNELTEFYIYNPMFEFDE